MTQFYLFSCPVKLKRFTTYCEALGVEYRVAGLTVVAYPQTNVEACSLQQRDLR